MKLKGGLIFLFVLCIHFSFAKKPTILLLDSNKNTSLRGLSVVNDNIVWCSGSNGTVGKSTDGGKSFAWLSVRGYEKRDFRDIEAFDAHTAVIMGIGEPAIILKTKDGGNTWSTVFEDSRKGMFLDAMSFDKKGTGLVIGDPIDGNMFQAFTKDSGESWLASKGFSLEKGEAFFASSGTNIQHTVFKKFSRIWVSGGTLSQLYFRGKNIEIPITKGKESTGANSIAVRKNRAVIVGGDFSNDKSRDSNCVLVKLAKHSKFSLPKTSPLGYRSCVIYYTKNKLLCCGTSGVDVSSDGGKTWKNVSTQSFHVVQKAKKGKAVFLAGSKGRLAAIKF